MFIVVVYGNLLSTTKKSAQAPKFAEASKTGSFKLYQEPVLKLDHIVRAAESLNHVFIYVEELLKMKLGAVGKNKLFGTHNKLFSLGNCYLKVNALDPLAQPLKKPSWYELEKFSDFPRLINWVCKTDNMEKISTSMSYDIGETVTVEKDHLIWDIAVADNGTLPFNGCAPSFVDWRKTQPPNFSLPDQGCRLKKLIITHPNLPRFAASVQSLLFEARIEMSRKDTPSLNTILQTPKGQVTL